MNFRDFFNLSGKKSEPSAAEVAAFVDTAAHGKEKAVKKFCKDYPDHVDATNEDGETALQAAVESNQRIVGDILLDAKADPNKPAKYGESPFLRHLSGFSFRRNDSHLLDSMFKAGANVNFQSVAWNTKGFRQEATLSTPLIYAAYIGEEELCDYLIKHGADPTLKDKFGFTPRDRALDRAIDQEGSHGSAEVAAALRKTAAFLEKAEAEWVKQQSSVKPKTQPEL